jgi:hypothetical protein
MLQKPSSGVLASLKGSTYQPRTPRPFARCGLAGGLLQHPPISVPALLACVIDSPFPHSEGFATVLG